MRLHLTSAPLVLIAALAACTGHDERPSVDWVQQPATAPAPAPKVASPMASFARMVGGEWRRPALTLINMFETWHWGPGGHSMQAQTYGTGIDAEPVRNLEVFYWHPGRKQVCLLFLSPFVNGVSQGTIRFEGDSADAVFDLYQTRDHRKMGLRWTFSGPDNYHSVLLEATGPEGLKPMNQWDYVRLKTLTPKPAIADAAKKPTEHLKAFQSLVGHTWESIGPAKRDSGSGGPSASDLQTQSIVEWIPYASAVYVQVTAPTRNTEPAHLLDAYFYHHTGTNVLRCLALSNSGGVYEGDVSVLDGGALQIDLKGYEGDRISQHIVQLDFEKDGTVRQRVWSIDGAVRTLTRDVHHAKLPSVE